MAAIRKTINENDQDDFERIERRSISKSESDRIIEGNASNPEAGGVQKNEKLSAISSKKTAQWLVEFFGEEVFNNLMKNKELNLPFTFDELSVEEWLLRSVKTIFSFEDVEKIEKSIKDNYFHVIAEQKQLHRDISEIKKQISAKDEEIKKEQEVQVSLKKNNRELEKSLATSFQIGAVFESVFIRDDQKGILRLIHEAIENPENSVSGFLLAFLKGWSALTPSLDKSYEGEDVMLEEVYTKMSNMLLLLKDLHIPQRRALLDAIARFVSSKFTEFDFVSPEETLQINIDLHNSKGMGGSKIKQGLTFAVVRKSNRQTYKYADIEVY